MKTDHKWAKWNQSLMDLINMQPGEIRVAVLVGIAGLENSDTGFRGKLAIVTEGNLEKAMIINLLQKAIEQIRRDDATLERLPFADGIN